MSEHPDEGARGEPLSSDGQIRAVLAMPGDRVAALLFLALQAQAEARFLRAFSPIDAADARRTARRARLACWVVARLEGRSPLFAALLRAERR